MNERIEQLAVEARQYAFGEVENSQDPTEWSTKYYNEMFEQKFAELIVRECAEQSMSIGRYNTPSGITPDLSIAIAVGLKKHFGVEE